MDFGFTEEQKLLQRNVRDFAKKEIGPSAARIDRDEEFPWDNFRKMGEIGLMGVSVDPQYGGSGGGYIDLSVVVDLRANRRRRVLAMRRSTLRSGLGQRSSSFVPVTSRAGALAALLR